ncbi:MAG: tRNA (N6-threonylcarbamoyladenosine(37)-N6)-methyltransferase TrmO [Lachnospiraceae bacterium]|nr:tRNA (N6-threonylcarbamoyladenosine(37)-N6)-methyltransferase TrmO [Lachnospiraceae bacterium]
MDELNLKPIAYIRTDFPEKFGIPRQSGIIPEIKGKIVFEPEFRDANALREIEQYTHLWLIWGFSDNRKKEGWEPTVRPPRLGGNVRVGVFASRSPYRPNPLGLTVVKLEKTEDTKEGKVLIVSGPDMKDMTPIYDIKPYLPYVDAIPEASDGFALNKKEGSLKVEFEPRAASAMDEEKRIVLEKVLSQDPRPQYQDEPGRIYKMSFGNMEIEFTVENDRVLVRNVEKRTDKSGKS